MEDKELIGFIKKDPEYGIHEAMKLYGNAVNTICRSILKDCADGLVDEAVSDTFFKLWKNCDRFSPGKGHSLKSYLYSVARNTAIDIRRKNGYQILSLDEDREWNLVSEFSVEHEVEQKTIKETLHQVIRQLGEPDSQVFLYKYFLFLKNKEIAESLNLTEKKVENILYRGKSKLKKLLAERGITGYENG